MIQYRIRYILPCPHTLTSPEALCVASLFPSSPKNTTATSRVTAYVYCIMYNVTQQEIRCYPVLA